MRFSSASSCGRKRGGFRLPAIGFRKPLPTADCRLPIADDSQEKNDMMFLLSDLLAGETSPAFVFQPFSSLLRNSMRKTEPDWLSKIRENYRGVIAAGAQTERRGLA